MYTKTMHAIAKVRKVWLNETHYVWIPSKPGANSFRNKFLQFFSFAVKIIWGREEALPYYHLLYVHPRHMDFL
jgi:hypothetical protein